jgi:phenylalanyl-tRNA synthetase alpha chain
MSAQELDSLKAEVLEAIARASDLGALEEVRVGALGKKGRVSALMQQLGSMPPEERRDFGQAVNTVKTAVAEALEARHTNLSRAATEAKLAHEHADVTLPVRDGPLSEGRIRFGQCRQV